MPHDITAFRAENSAPHNLTIYYTTKMRNCQYFMRAVVEFFAESLMGTSKNRFEKGKWVEGTECEESRRRKAVCLARRFDEAGGVLCTFSLK